MTETTTKGRRQETVNLRAGHAKFEDLMNAMMTGKAVNWEHEDPEIEHKGRKIILPAEPGPMDTEAAIETLQRKLEDDNVEMDATQVVDAYPHDAAVAFFSAMRNLYGWASARPTPSFFGPIPPSLLTIQTGPDSDKDFVQVPWGEFKIPGIENNLTIGAKKGKYGPQFVVSGMVKKKEMHIVRELVELTKEILKSDSIYKGKAIRLVAKTDGTVDFDTPPAFLPTAYINPDELVLNDDERSQVQASIWTPIQKTAEALKNGIPLKRTNLLEGEYGIGKTMLANTTSLIAVQNGWTFIVLDDVRGLKDALLFAQRYEPAVVFAEDVDRVTEIRDNRANDIINTIDGVLSKNSKVITVLTTNFVEKLDKAMLRPGRLDSVISIRAPQEKAVIQLVFNYSRGLLAKDSDMTSVADALKGQKPSTIREVVERSKLGMIGRGDDHITPEDLVTAANGMKRHLELLNGAKPEMNSYEKLGRALGTVIQENVGLDDDTITAINGIKELSHDLKINVIGNLMAASKNAEAAASASRTIRETIGEVTKKVDEVKKDTAATRKKVAA